MTDMQNTEQNQQAGLTDASRGTGHPAPGALTPSQSQELSVSLSVIADGRLQVSLSSESLPGLGLAETRWTGNGHFFSDTGCTVIYPGNDKLKAAGVAVLVDRGLGKSLLDYNPISERIMTVRLAARPWNMTLIIQVYAPTIFATVNRLTKHACLTVKHVKDNDGCTLTCRHHAETEHYNIMNYVTVVDGVRNKYVSGPTTSPHHYGKDRRHGRTCRSRS